MPLIRRVMGSLHYAVKRVLESGSMLVSVVVVLKKVSG